MNKNKLNTHRRNITFSLVKKLESIVGMFSKPYFKTKFLTYHLRPKQSKYIHLWSDELILSPAQAIVVQGPLMIENDFTYETLLLYKKIYRNAHIIFSTWKSENQVILSKIKKEGIHVVQSDQPKNSGPTNINFQIVSTNQGILLAKELGAKYILKLRTDQRIQNPNILEFLHNLLTHFSSPGHLETPTRIISTLAHKYLPYTISDMLNYGHIDQMLLYWDGSLIGGSQSKVHTIRDRLDSNSIAEVILVKRYLELRSLNVENSISAYWNHLKNQFIIIDSSMFDFFWNKYSRREYPYDYYYQTHRSRLLTFSEWFNLFAGILNKCEINEGNILDKQGRTLSKLDVYPPNS
jgi:hypothetical protein